MQNSDMAEDIWERPADRLEPRPGSLEDLYVRHIPDAVRLAFLLTRDGGTAEDLAQDAFIKVAGRIHHGMDAEHLRGEPSPVDRSVAHGNRDQRGDLHRGGAEPLHPSP
ncbi:MAG: hypothetical protein OEV60_09915 [Actinomycetota bacterium]|nr:hypothetical protein [Actinomycetota bacterium]